MLSITLVSRDNGVGLSTDMTLLSDLFRGAGHRVMRVDWRTPRIAPCDVVIFLELLSPHLFRYGRKTIGIFNPEWFQLGWRVYASRLDQIWAKSSSAYDIFRKMNPRTHYTGFLTRDLWDPSVPRESRVVHVQGHSQDKNTERVMEAWSAFPDLPSLTVLTQKPLRTPARVRRLGRVPERELRRLLNSHDIHLCPSRVEGWGHYITEAVSTGAYTITTDLPPMNEHVRPEWGALLAPSVVDPRGVTHACDVRAADIADAVRRAYRIPEEDRGPMRVAARAHMERRNAEFSEISLKLLEA